MGELREAYDRFNALREEVSTDRRSEAQTPADFVQATHDVGEEWVTALCKRCSLEVDDLLEVAIDLDRITSPSLVLVLSEMFALSPEFVSKAALSAGLSCGVFIGLMVAEERRRDGGDADGGGKGPDRPAS